MTFGIVPHNSKTYWQAVALRSKLLREPLQLQFSKQELEDEKNQLHFVALNKFREVVATTVVLQLNKKRFKIRQVCVKESEQRKGIGRKLNNFVESYLSNKVELPITLELHARLPAISFYESLGYTKQGKQFIEIGITHQKLVKTLP